MADPLSVIASVIGVASAGIAIATKLHNLVDRFGTTFNDIEVISSDLNGFSIVLREVGNKLNVPSSERIASELLIDGLTKLMETCKVLFIDIRRMIERVYGDKMTQFKTKVKWIFRETRIRGIKATLECQKTTLNLMLQILLDDQSSFQRRILENLSREHEHTVKVIQEIGKENAALEKENAALKSVGKNHSSSSEIGGQSMVYLPGAVSRLGSSGREQLKRSATIVLSNIVPRQSREAKDRVISYPVLESGGGSLEKEPISETPTQDPMYSAYYVPPENRYPLEDLGMAIGVSASALQKTEIDLLLSKWIQKPGIQAKTTMDPPNVYALPASRGLPNSYIPLESSSSPTAYGSQASRDHPGYPNSNDPQNPDNHYYDHASLDWVKAPVTNTDEHRLTGSYDPVKRTKAPSLNTAEMHAPSKPGIDAAADDTKVKVLEAEYEYVVSQIELQKSKNQAHKAELMRDMNMNAETLMLAFKRDDEFMEKANESSRSELEKKLMQCEADEERRQSVEAELERGRQDFAQRMSENPSQSQVPLQRHIQNMQDRLAHDRVELGNLSNIRKDLLQTLKLLQKDHELQISARKEKYEKDIEKSKGKMLTNVAADEQRLQDLEIRKTSLELELKKHTENLEKSGRESSKPAGIAMPVTMPMHHRKISITEKPPYPVNYTREFKVPDWLEESSIEAEPKSDDENIVELEGSRKPVGKNSPEVRSPTSPSGHTAISELPATPLDHEHPRTSSSSPIFTRPPIPTVESSHSSQASSPWRFESESSNTTPVSSSTTTLEQPKQKAAPATEGTLQEPLPPAASNPNSVSELRMSAVSLMCRRPAWKPPLTCLYGPDTLASILSQSTFQILFFKASQDAYHFFLSASPTPFYIIDLVPSDLTTHQTSTIQWTVIPKIWASKKALTASGYVFEEDTVGQVWIRKELNWHQILQLFDFSCNILDNRLNTASRRVLGKRAEEKEERSTAQTTSRLLSRLRGLKEMKILEELHGGFFDAK